MDQSGSFSLSSLSSSQSQFVSMSIANPDAYNPIIRASQIVYNISFSGNSNGILKLYDLVFENPLAGWESPVQNLSVIDGQISGSSSYVATLPTWISPQQAWSVLAWEPSAGDNSGSISVSWATSYSYPPVVPSSGFPINYVDINTGYVIPLFIVYPDHVDFLGKALTNHS